MRLRAIVPITPLAANDVAEIVFGIRGDPFAAGTVVTFRGFPDDGDEIIESQKKQYLMYREHLRDKFETV